MLQAILANPEKLGNSVKSILYLFYHIGLAVQGNALAFFIPAITALFVLLMALIGLILNLKMPNLNWTDETVPVKQSLGVMLTLFGGWVLVFALGGIYYALMRYISTLLYLVLVSVLLAGASAALFGWINTKGAKIFKEL